MSIRDIIEAAEQGPWKYDREDGFDEMYGPVIYAESGLVAATDYLDDEDGHSAHFIATFDPEHVALMEAVCEAATGLDKARQRGATARGDIVASVTALECCSRRLEAYRVERGLA